MEDDRAFSARKSEIAQARIDAAQAETDAADQIRPKSPSFVTRPSLSSVNCASQSTAPMTASFMSPMPAQASAGSPANRSFEGAATTSILQPASVPVTALCKNRLLFHWTKIMFLVKQSQIL